MPEPSVVAHRKAFVQDMTLAKIAHITTVDSSLRYLLLNQLRTIKEAGYEVVAISAPGPDVQTVRDAGIRHIAVPMSRKYSPFADLVALLRLAVVLRRERFDIVHTHTPKASLLGQYAALLARVPIRVHTIHGLYFPGHLLHRRWRLLPFVLLEKITMAFSHMNLSQNPEDVPTALQHRICREDRLRLLGNGIDLTGFNPDAYSMERRRALRATIGLSPNHKVVGMVARFVAEKGYLEMLDAAERIREAEPRARFIFAGSIEAGKSDGLSPEIIRERRLDDVVRFLGHRTDVADLYAMMDVLALPSYREGFPRVPMEAAAMGVPAVVTDIRGCRQTVEEGVNGFLVPARNATALADRLLQVLKDDSMRERFGAAARRKALVEFDERKVFDRVMAAYDELLDVKDSGHKPS